MRQTKNPGSVPDLAYDTLTFKTPFRILPPATPPFRSSTSQPGLFTSNDLMTEDGTKR